MSTENDSVPWCDTGKPDPHLLASYFALHAVWFVNIVLVCIGAYNLIKMERHQDKDLSNKHKHKRLSSIFNILYIIISLLFIISPPGFAFSLQAGWECWYNQFLPWEGTAMVGLTPYMVGLTAIYLFFLLRMKIIFDGIAIQLHKLFWIIFLISFILQLILSILTTFYFLSGWDDYNRTWALRYLFTYHIIYLITSTLMLIIFIKKILLSISTIKQSKNNSFLNSKKLENEMFSVIIRYMVCAVIAMMSTNFVDIIAMFRGEVPGIHDNLVIRALHVLCISIDETVNLICLYLQFSFGSNLYNKCCHGIDSCFRSCCPKILHVNTDNNKHIQNGNMKDIITKNHLELEIESNVKKKMSKKNDKELSTPTGNTTTGQVTYLEDI
eukprot:187119_1